MLKYEALESFFLKYRIAERNWLIRYLEIFRNLAPSRVASDESNTPDLGSSAWYPFKRIPDVRVFKISLRNFDQLYALFGIRKRFAPAMEFQKYNNRSANRYALHQLTRMEKALIQRDMKLY
jgi:hypothetical protein